MEVFHQPGEVRDHVSSMRSKGFSIGFVPTMGALHRGHIQLVNRALADNDVVITSIFVNPTQFNDPSDLEKYPRSPEEDIQMLQEAGCHVLFMPSVEDMYPEKVESVHYPLEGLDEVMEGAFRPGHFQGVATVVNRLFDIVTPDRAYFGEKDFQQLAIIRKITDWRKDQIDIIGVPTERESDGLAMSSRNLRLSKVHRAQAHVIAQALNFARDHFREFDPKALVEEVSKRITVGTDLEVEYVSVADSRTLKPVSGWANCDSARIFAAVFAGDVRLIDNVPLF